MTTTRHMVLAVVAEDIRRLSRFPHPMLRLPTAPIEDEFARLVMFLAPPGHPRSTITAGTFRVINCNRTRS